MKKGEWNEVHAVLVLFYRGKLLFLKQETTFSYQPGDAFNVICPNYACEVDELIHLLGLSEKKGHLVCLKVKPGTKRKGTF